MGILVLILIMIILLIGIMYEPSTKTKKKVKIPQKEDPIKQGKVLKSKEIKQPTPPLQQKHSPLQITIPIQRRPSFSQNVSGPLVKQVWEWRKDKCMKETIPQIYALKEIRQYNSNARSEYPIFICNDRGAILHWYYADIIDLENWIVFEIDGGYHNTAEQREKDELRTEELEKLGLSVVRFTNREVSLGSAACRIKRLYEDLNKRIYCDLSI